jgi:curved DNA-binding protein CbpA
MTTPSDDLYQRLEIDPVARQQVVAAAYRVIAKSLHPDTTGRDTTREMAALNAAYEVLRDPAQRAAYDRSRTARPVASGVVYMAFGKYTGEPIDTVPTSYLRWAHRNLENEDYLFDVTQELIRRGAIS